MKGKKLIFLFVLSLGLLANGLNLNSLGSRAQAMGGAYVAVAEGPSAVFWNPAGITSFKDKTLGVYLTDIIPSGSYQFAPLGVDASYSKNYFAGLFSIYVPLNERLVAGVAIYTPSGLGTQWDGKDFAAFVGGNELEWNSKIGMLTVSPAISYKLSDAVSVGLALNANYGMMSLKTSAGGFQYAEESSGWGFSVTAGIMARPSDRLSLGLSFKSASKISLSGDVTMEFMRVVSALYGTEISTTSGFTRDITWPMWIGFGISFRPTDKLLLSADLHWTQWSKEDVLVTDYENSLWKLVFATTPENEGEMVLNWKDTTQVRLGMEYLLKENLAVRLGYYIDPSPAPDETMNVLLPSFDFNVITLGLGFRGDAYNLDLGLEYLMGKERNIAPSQHNMPGVYKMNILAPSVTFTYKF